MFSRKRKAGIGTGRQRIGAGLICMAVCLVLVIGLSGAAVNKINRVADVDPAELIRLHVIANSDNEEDQMLKLAVRDEILQKLAPRLAEAKSLAEAREVIREMEGELIYTAEQVVKGWGKNYPVSFDHGRHLFPTKSYGNIVLPGGEYEAVKIKIGRAEGANWWCILFPPLCFVNVEESTTITASGEQEAAPKADAEPVLLPTISADGQAETPEYQRQKSEYIPGLTYKGKKVGFFLLKFFR